jgi:glutamate/tyrosine decarboxylase-like PLP-dependent enzyme
MAPDEFRRVGHALVDSVAAFLTALPERPVTTGESPGAIRALLNAAQSLPATGADAGALLRSAAELLFEHSLFNGHPRFMAYITSSGAPLGALADLLASTVNPNCGSFSLSPMATLIEQQSVQWSRSSSACPPGRAGSS